MEDSAVELVLVSTCRCCIAVSENEPFDNIFECIFEGVNLEDILNLLAPISLTIDDGKFIGMVSKLFAYKKLHFRTHTINLQRLQNKSHRGLLISTNLHLDR